MTPDLIGQFARLAWDHLWQLTVVIVVMGALVRLICRDRPRLAYMLWMLVILKALVPPVWSSPTGIFSWILANSRAAQAGDTGSTVVTLSVPLEATKTVDDGRRSTVAAKAASDDDSDLGMDEVQVKIAILSVWLSGSLLCTAFVIGKQIACSMLIRRSSIVADESYESSLAELSRRLGVKQAVRLLVTSRPIGPVVFGLLRPTLLLPEPLLSGKTGEQIELIIAHELVHVRRGDVLAGKLQLVAQLVWWFHPLVWWANREACRERERCCDEEVVSGLGCKPVLYARTLLAVLELKRQLRSLIALPGVRPLEVTSRRLEYIMRNSNVYRRRTFLLSRLIFPAGAVLLVPGAGMTFEDRPPSGDSADAAINPGAAPQAEPQVQPPPLPGEDHPKARDGTVHNLKVMGLAMGNYVLANDGRLPTAAISKGGKPLLSWRVAILPFLDQKALYDKFHLDEPWDSPHNKGLLAEMPAVYAPVVSKGQERNTTYYQVCVGKGSLFDGEQGTKLADVTDKAGVTLVVIEAAEPVLWTKPEDVAFQRQGPPPKFGGQFEDGSYVTFADGSARFLSSKVAPKTLHALITRDGGEVVTFDMLGPWVRPAQNRR